MDKIRETQKFITWLASTDLGPLEDVRHYVEAHAIENIVDVEVERQFEVAKATVAMWIDDPDSQHEFDGYR